MSYRLSAGLLLLLVLVACEPLADLVEPPPQPQGWIRHTVPEPAFSTAAPPDWRPDESSDREWRLFMVTPGDRSFSVRVVEGTPPEGGDEVWLAWLVETPGLFMGTDLGWVETPVGRARHAAVADLADVYFVRHPEGQVLLFTFLDPAFNGPLLELNRAVMETLRFDPVR